MRNAVKLFAQSWRNQPRESLAWSGMQPVRRLFRPRRIPCKELLLDQTCPRFALLRWKGLTSAFTQRIHRARVNPFPAS